MPLWTGLLAAAPLAVATPLAPFWGVLADRYSHKLIILRSLFIASVAYGLAALAQDVWQYLLIRFLLGLTFGSNAVIIAVIASVAPDRRLGLAIGITQMMFPVGKSIGPLLGSGLIQLVGLRGMLAADAVLALVAFLLVLLLFREPPRRHDRSTGIFQRLTAVASIVWQVPSIRLTFLLFALFAGGMGLVTPYLPVLIERVYVGENLALVIGVILAGYGALAAVGAPLAGRLADRLGPSRLVTFNMVGLMLMSLGLIVAQTPWQVAATVLLGAIPFGASNTSLYAFLVRQTPREHMSAVMSLTPMSRNAAMLVGPLLGSAVAGFGLEAVFGVAALIYLIALVLSFVLARLGRQHEEQLAADHVAT